MQNVVHPPPSGDAVLSQCLPQQVGELRQTERHAVHEARHHPRIGQHRRSQQARLVEDHAVQGKLELGVGIGRRWLLECSSRRWRPVCRVRFAAGRHAAAGVEPLLLQLPGSRAVVSGTTMVGAALAMAPAAAERAPQVPPAGIAGMREKPNPTVCATGHAGPQLRMRFQHRVQHRLVVADQRLGLMILVPIRPKRENFLDGNDKKARFSATIPSVLCTTSSYPIDAQASRGGARFFLCPPQARTANRRSCLPALAPKAGAHANQHCPPENGCLKEGTLSSSFQVVGQLSRARVGQFC
jgi:hypothetical protein